MSALTATARQAANLARLSSLKATSASASQAASLIHRRGLAGGDHHGPAKVNFWEDPMSPSKWKEEHFVIISLTGWGLAFYGGYKFFPVYDLYLLQFVIISLTGWGLAFYGGYKFFTGGKKDKKEEKVGDASR